MFGFWRRLTSKRRSAFISTPCLHSPLPPGTNRSQLHGYVINLNILRPRRLPRPMFTPNVQLSSGLDQIENLLRAVNPSWGARVIATPHCRTQFSLAADSCQLSWPEHPRSPIIASVSAAVSWASRSMRAWR